MIGADETVRVRYRSDTPQVEAERRKAPRQNSRTTRSPGSERSRTSYQGKRIAAAKREDRERRQRGIRIRRTLGLVALVSLVVLIVWGIGAFYRSSVFSIETIETAGMSRLDRADVLALASVPAASTLIRVDTSDIERRLEASPWVKDASVERDFPRTIRLTVRERRPAAIADAGGTNLWVVSADGYWLGKRSARDTDTVVIRDIEGLEPRPGRRIDSKELLNAVRVAAGLSQELRAMTRAISASTVEKTALITTEDVEVFIGPATQLAAKDRIAREILKSKKGEVVYINVRVVESPIWRGLDE